VYVPLQCLNKTLLYCDNLLTNYTCPPFSGPVFVVLHFQVLHFQSTYWNVFAVIMIAVIVSERILSINKRMNQRVADLVLPMKYDVVAHYIVFY